MSLGVIVEYRHIDLSPADNGFVLRYDEVREKPGKMDSRDWHSRKMVFGDDEAGLDAAMEAMKKMYVFNKSRKGDPTIDAPVLKMETSEDSMS